MRFSHQRTAQSELLSNQLTSNMPFQLDGVCAACSVAMGLLWAAEYFHLPSDPHWFNAFCGDVVLVSFTLFVAIESDFVFLILSDCQDGSSRCSLARE